jgi:hypothetical protein
MAKDDSHEDRQERIRKLRERIEELGGGEAVFQGESDLPEEIEEVFLEHVLAFEEGHTVTPIAALSDGGLTFPVPDELEDAELSTKLWELIHGLALLGVYLHSTNHLSDRQLYELLLNDVLLEETVLFPENPDYGYHIDMIGSGSREDVMTFLKYYASEEDRAEWMEELDGQVPAHEDPPHNRDHRLPKGPGG